MKINFLQDAEGSRLTKTYTPTEVRPYPNAAMFNSFHYEVDSLESFYEPLLQNAKLGYCLLKGELPKKLTEERRAGTTSALVPTQYLLLDLDFDGGFDSVDHFLDAIGINDVSYILHHSASSGIRSKTGLRVHLVILLDEPKSPNLLKSWLQYLNLTVPELRDLCQLSANGFSLKWALDVTTCQNDKLIFIADPTCEGVDDPMAGKRFELHKRSHEAWTFPFKGSEFAALTDQTSDLINERREEQGLPRRKATFGSAEYDGGTVEYLKNPTRAQVTSWKDGRGFVYLNLNGGDSWGYYYPAGKPEYLRNFKGEPVVRLRDIDPEYYAGVVQEEAEEPKPESPQGEAPLRWMFVNREQDGFFLAEWKAGRGVKTSKHSYKLCTEWLGEEPEQLEEWTLEFAPWRKHQAAVPSERWINTYHPTPYADKKNHGEKAEIPELIQKVLLSALSDQETVDHFLKWLAYIWQVGHPARTAWLLKGVEGTGKGVIINSIIKPLFGSEVCFSTIVDKALEKHNGWMRNKMFLWIDEGEIRTERASELMGKLKNMITEPHIAMREMRTDAENFPNNLNIIVATNSKTPIVLKPDDRRWNVAPTQNTPLATHMDVEELSNRVVEVLPSFVAYLAALKIDQKNPPRALDNEAKRELIQSSINSNEEFFYALAEGNLDYFCENYFNSPYPKTQPHRAMYRLVLAGWAKRIGEENWVINTEVFSAFHFISNSTRGENMRTFGKNCAKHLEAAHNCTVNGQSQRGWRITWKLENEIWMSQLQELIAEVEAGLAETSNVIAADFTRGRIRA